MGAEREGLSMEHVMLLNHAHHSIDQSMDQELVVHAPSTYDVSPPPSSPSLLV